LGFIINDRCGSRSPYREGKSVKARDLSSLDTVLGSSHIASEIRKMEEAQRVWARNLEPMNTIANQIRELTETNSIAVQLANQFRDMETQRFENIKKMLGPLADIHKSLMLDSSINRMLEDFAKPPLVNDELARLWKDAGHFGGAAKAMQDSMQSSLAHAQETIAAASITSDFSQVMKTYEEAQKRWAVPAELIGSVGALKAMQEQVGKLTLPVIDWASAATLAKMLGPEGIAAQLVELGIGPEGTLSEHALPPGDQGIGISRKAMELMALLSFILVVLVPIYQEFSSRERQQQTDKKLEAQSVMLEAHAKRFEALSNLVEEALIKEAKRVDERFVVLGRIAVVRSEPQHGSAVVGKLLPREVVRPISEQGKWIQFEYYHWLIQEHQTGWALKKYFKRVPATYSQDSSRLPQ
jgi:hypothetical protein